MILDRLRRVVTFRAGVFAEIADDDQATLPALGVVAVVAGLPALVHMLLPALLAGGGPGVLGLLVTIGGGLLFGMLAWVVLTGLLTLSSRLFAAEPPRFVRLFRVFGFAFAPLILMLEPIVGAAVAIVWFIALLVATVREVCRLTTVKAMIAVLPLVILPPGITMITMILSDRFIRLMNLFG